MPSVEALLVFAALSLGLAVTPGPNMLYLVSRSLAQGTGAGMVSLAGCQTGSLAIMLCAAAGITAHALSNLPVLVLGLLFLGREGLTFGKVAEMTARRPPGGGTTARAASAPAGREIASQEAAR